MTNRVPAPDGKRDREGRPLLIVPDGTLSQKGYRLTYYTVGGMSVAYRAVKGDVTYFVKEVDACDERRVASIEHEFRLLGSLEHPCIVRVHDFFELDGFYYLVQDFVEGQSLEKLVSSESENFVDEEILQEWASQIYDLFEFLHTHNPPVIYRDLKPSNIIRDPQGRLHLVDFGISRIFQEGKDRDTEPLGSAMTASPEHYGRRQTDVRSDIFTIGATLHYLATNGRGRSGIPFEFEPARAINESLSPQFEQVLKKAIELDPVKRFQTIDEMRRAHLKMEPGAGKKPASSHAQPGGREGGGIPPPPVRPSGMKPRRIFARNSALLAVIALFILMGVLALKQTALIPPGTAGISMAPTRASRR
jgi:serine/threonine protein kinase, bacterial